MSNKEEEAPAPTKRKSILGGKFPIKITLKMNINKQGVLL